MIEVGIIALALAMDAFGVALSIGINSAVRRKNKIYFAISFGFFQFALSLAGAVGGYFFNNYIATIPNIIGGGIIAIVGGTYGKGRNGAEGRMHTAEAQNVFHTWHIRKH